MRSGTEESRERKIALFLTLVRAFENGTPITQEEIVASLTIDDFESTGKVPKKKLAYDGNDNAYRQKFERDKAAIRDLGFEILTTKTLFDVDGYSIDPSSVYVPAIDFSDDELTVAAWSVQLLGIGSAGVGRLFSDGPWPEGGIEFSTVLQPLARAAALSRVVSFRHRKNNDKVKSRTLAPLEFLYWRSQSYVIGVEPDSGDVKGFKVSRIVGVPSVTELVYESSEDQRRAARTWLPTSDPERDYAFRFHTSAGFARLLRSQYPDVRIDPRGERDDVVEVEVPVASSWSALRAVLSFGDHVAKLRPKSLRDEVLTWLKGVNRRPTNLPSVPAYVAQSSRSDTLGQTLQLISAVYHSSEPLRASQLAQRCRLDVELVRSIMSRLMALQYMRDPTKYLVHIEPGDDFDDEEALDDPRYVRSASYERAVGSALAPLTWRDAYELLVALKEAAALYPTEVLNRVIHKIEGVIHTSVRVIESEPASLSSVSDAVTRHQRIKVEYWSAASDEVSERYLEPRALSARNGHWYVRAFCTRREAWLTFRVDRILTVLAAEPANVTRPVDLVEDWIDRSGEDGAVVTIVLPRDRRWLFEPLPTLQWSDLDAEHEIVRLSVRDGAFLDRLMVEAGPGCYVLDGDERAGLDLADRMASRL